MVGFLRWLRSIVLGTLNGLVKFALAIALIVIALVLIGVFEGDGLPANMVLTLDLRSTIPDSSPQSPFALSDRAPTVMNIVLALDEAQRDPRVKGLVMTVGGGGLSTASAEQIGAAVKRFRASGKFVTAFSHGFVSTGLGDYLVATSADHIWMQPQSPFSPAGTGGGEIFLRGLFDKIHAQPQMVKREEYKSAADMYTEKDMTGPDRQQLTALMQSTYDSATNSMAIDRRITKNALVAMLNNDPQFAEAAKKTGLIDSIGYDDDVLYQAKKAAGAGAKAVSLMKFYAARDQAEESDEGPHIAIIEASGDIVDGSAGGGGLFGQSAAIASDDLSKAIRQAADDKSVRAIVLRVDSPGGSVTASDQIHDAVRKAQAKGKPVVISMGSLAASGGYYISCGANEIVAEPGTITGSIGVLTGKVAIGDTLRWIGVGADEVAVGKNALFDSALTPFTADQLANLNAQADLTYNAFMHKVAAGRKLPFSKVQQIAKGRVWSGTDALTNGLVDQLGGLWTAVDDAKKLAHIPAADRVVFKRFPAQKGFFQALGDLFGGSVAGVRAMEGVARVMSLPPLHAAIEALETAPQGKVELRATNLPTL